MTELETGVYCFKNDLNGKVYIGSTRISFAKRLKQHLYCLSKNKHKNSYLQSAWVKYKGQFTFSVLERCEGGMCLIREQYWLDFYRSYDRNIGYNINKKAESNAGSTFSEKGLANIRKANAKRKGVKLSDETRNKIKAGLNSPEVKAKCCRGNYLRRSSSISSITRTKISIANKGKTRSQNTKSKLRLANLGKKHSSETKAKMSKSQHLLGQRDKENRRLRMLEWWKNASIEDRRKRIVGRVGVPLTDERKENISKSLANLSEETKARLSYKRRLMKLDYWAKNRLTNDHSDTRNLRLREEYGNDQPHEYDG